MIFRQSYLVYILILLLSVQNRLEATSSNITFSIIDCVEGLSGNRVRAMGQLPDGRMVFNANEILSLYDGHKFKYLHYNSSNITPLSGYLGNHRMYITKDKIWIKNQNKLLVVNIVKDKFEADPLILLKATGVKDMPSDLFIDSQNGIWVTSPDCKLIRCNTSNHTSEIFLKDYRILSDKSDILLDLAVFNDQLYLFFHSGLVVRYNLTTALEIDRFLLNDNTHLDLAPTMLVVSDNNYLYLLRNGPSGRLMRFDYHGNRWEEVLHTKNYLNVLSIDKQNNIWVTGPDGIWNITSDLKNRKHIPQLKLVDGRLLHSEISTIYNDRQGGTWLGTVNRGVLYYHPDRFKFRMMGRNLFHGISNDIELKITCFAEISNTEILVGTNKALFIYNSFEKKIKEIRNLNKDLYCTNLTKDKKGRVWLTTSSNGVYCFYSSHRWKHYDIDNLTQLYETSQGSFLGISTQEGLLFFYPDKDEAISVNKEIDKNILLPIFQLTKYDDNTVIGISSKGFIFYNFSTNTITSYNFEQKEKWKNINHTNHSFNSVYRDRQGVVWLATLDGLHVWNPDNDEMKSLYMEDGLVNNSIHAIVEDTEGNIWATSANGISRITVKNENGNMNFSFSNFNRTDGVLEREFIERAAYIDEKMVLYFGGVDGFNTIDLQSIKEASLVHKPLLTDFRVFGRSLGKSSTQLKEINLQYNQNYFSLDFTAMNYINPSQTYYAFKLEGVDQEWRELTSSTGTGSVDYTNIAPGRYTFLVKAAYNSKNWDRNETKLIINIGKPWWNTTLAYLVYSILAILLLVLSLKLWNQRYRNRLKKQKEVELNLMKFRFFTNISHEFRTPLTLIITPLESVLKTIDNGEVKTKLKTIHRNSLELLSLVNQLLDFRKLEAHGEKLILSYGDFVEFADTLQEEFNALALGKNISFQIENNIGAQFFFYFDRYKLHIIINNLLSNSFKHTEAGGKISIIIGKTDEWICISVKDTGYGIPSKDLPFVFDRFYQVKENHMDTGSGIGLHLTQEYVYLHNGKIKVQSEEGKGSLFEVYIPTILRPEPVDISPLTTADNIDISISVTNITYTILLVDDNLEFIEFLKEILSEKYHILTAFNGEEAEQIAKNKLPNLVISDIMMPGIDGLELTKRIKSSIEISHIPVILLTARSTDESKLYGFESGADEYISKPFNVDILLLRVEKLIKEQQAREQNFAHKIDVNPTEITISSVDELFISKALGWVEKNMDNTEYSVEKLSSDIGMERTVLYRKLQSITGRTPTEFIRTIRLKRGAQLLKKGYAVNDVAYRVGFNNPKYFSKYFKEAFGIIPSRFK